LADSAGSNDKSTDDDGFGAATSSASDSDAEFTQGNFPPLTEAQQEVVDDVTHAQREVGGELRRSKWRAWRLRGGAEEAMAESDEERATADEELADLRASVGEPKAPVAADAPVLTGGPPTTEEVRDAEMNPWRGHGMAETIEHNRELRDGSDGGPPDSGSSD
jgi:hypothetical protein